MVDVASQAGDTDFSGTSGLTSYFQGSINVHRSTLSLVLQRPHISYFVFYACACSKTQKMSRFRYCCRQGHFERNQMQNAVSTRYL